ncbi:DUF2268 domain-containing putative Zn-dependent protease [Ureibacillus chungkukjangi]|uniref:DUF2268 domain-containing protein n=1 Tax=Ureibacillus chungkukjangi TaxID=1202712 RepID=UPI002040EF81|nr:DUF2268 domain-containing putative Zn-dependent protease [Ureibacillus chungkukjangi]MCM3388769.1 DUF2268 domain-containing putative Zn-dependent protease [Ureibacillus chungkukjangi]
MSVEDTVSILKSLNELSKILQGESFEEVHRKLIANPLKEFFPQATQEEIHRELLTRGLFVPSESQAIDGILRDLENEQVWETIRSEYKYLQQEWGGPDVPIFIYPLTKHRPIMEGVEVRKNGVSYNGLLFLFVGAKLESEELKALLAHEYHHICRMSYLNKSPYKTELLDTLIMEGMAEYAVENLYGEQWLSPWTKRYSQENCLDLWTKFFVPALKVKGVDNHFSFLYGNLAEGIPHWSGYCIGYRIVCSYIENQDINDITELFKMSAAEILKGSAFKLS